MLNELVLVMRPPFTPNAIHLERRHKNSPCFPCILFLQIFKFPLFSIQEQISVHAPCAVVTLVNEDLPNETVLIVVASHQSLRQINSQPSALKVDVLNFITSGTSASKRLVSTVIYRH